MGKELLAGELLFLALCVTTLLLCGLREGTGPRSDEATVKIVGLTALGFIADIPVIAITLALTLMGII